MPAFQSVVLTDRATTPVNRTFTPQTKKDGVYTVTWSPDGTLASAYRLSISRRSVNGKVKVRLLLAVPVVQTETIDGIARPSVVREAYCDFTFTFSTSSTEEERNNVIGMFASGLATTKALLNDTLVKGEDVF